MGFVSYATLVCCNGVEDDISGACRIGRNAMLALKQNDKSASARLYSIYYGFFAINVEPIQSCSDMLKRGFELGMTVGDTSR